MFFLFVCLFASPLSPPPHPGPYPLPSSPASFVLINCLLPRRVWLITTQNTHTHTHGSDCFRSVPPPASSSAEAAGNSRLLLLTVLPPQQRVLTQPASIPTLHGDVEPPGFMMRECECFRNPFFQGRCYSCSFTGSQYNSFKVVRKNYIRRQQASENPDINMIEFEASNLFVCSI